MPLLFLIYLHPIARSSALETAARHDACLGNLGWSTATGLFTVQGVDCSWFKSRFGSI